MPALKRTYSQYGGQTTKNVPNKARKAFSRTPKKGKKSFESTVRKIILDVKETKTRANINLESVISNNAVEPQIVEIPFDIPVGDHSTFRDGNQIIATAIQGKFLFRNNGTGNLSQMWMRMSLLYIKQGKALTDAQAKAKMWEPTTGNVDLAQYTDLRDIVATYNSELFTVVDDRVFKLSPSGATTADGDLMVEFNKKLNQKLYFENSVTEHPVNGRYIVVIHAHDAANDAESINVEYTNEVRVWFKDN